MKKQIIMVLSLASLLWGAQGAGVDRNSAHQDYIDLVDGIIKRGIDYNVDDALVPIRDLRGVDILRAGDVSTQQGREIVEREVAVIVQLGLAISNRIDKSFDTKSLKNMPAFSVAAPSDFDGKDLMSIKDEKARMAYAAAVRENKNKAERYTAQLSATRDYKVYCSVASKYIIDLYAAARGNAPNLITALDAGSVGDLPELVAAIRNRLAAEAIK